MSGMYICDALWAAFGAIWLLWAIWIKKAERRESHATHFVHSGLVAVGFLLMFSDVQVGWLHLRLLPRAFWLEALGIGVTLAGFAFATWARIHLGRNWSSSVTSRVQHELIRSGPYRWVRHPIYSGLLLALAGTALVRGELCTLFSLVVVYAGWKLKSRLEERMMTGTFGQEYTAYANATGALVPRIRNESN